MNNIPKYLMYVLMGVAVVVFLFAFGIDQEDASTYGNADPLLYTAYIYSLITVLAGLAGAVMGILIKPQSAKSILIGIGLMIVVFIIAYTLADGSDYERFDTTETLSKVSGTLLYALYILFFGAVASVLASWVIRLTR